MLSSVERRPANWIAAVVASRTKATGTMATTSATAHLLPDGPEVSLHVEVVGAAAPVAAGRSRVRTSHPRVCEQFIALMRLLFAYHAPRQLTSSSGHRIRNHGGFWMHVIPDLMYTPRYRSSALWSEASCTSYALAIHQATAAWSIRGVVNLVSRRRTK